MRVKIKTFIKNEVVLCIAIAIAIISMLFVTPSKEYVDYIDYRVLVLLFALMTVVAGLKSLGAFNILGEKLCSKTRKSRQLILILIWLCFFCSMLITNDVSLITFVPFTITIFKLASLEDKLITTICLETIAANLGSMFTPIGNPQNLLIFSKANMTVTSFLGVMLKPTLLSLIFVTALTFFIKNKDIVVENRTDNNQRLVGQPKFWIYIILFFVCLGNVFHLYSYWIVLAIVAISVLIVDRKLFSQVDYSLLFTFVGFFVFIGNMKQIEGFTNWLNSIVIGKEVLVGVLSSQIISNVPAAMLLSGFTDNYRDLLLGVNLGGLGTLIASMASLISYRFYAKAYPEAKGKYFKSFTIYNFVLLIILYVILKFIM